MRPATRIGWWVIFEGGHARRLSLREWLACAVLRIRIMVKP